MQRKHAVAEGWERVRGERVQTTSTTGIPTGLYGAVSVTFLFLTPNTPEKTRILVKTCMVLEMDGKSGLACTRKTLGYGEVEDLFLYNKIKSNQVN